jgi:anti-sigma factor RsiW
MTPTDDTDLQQLDGYLDDALTPEESETLRARLEADANLRDALSHLREERTLRRAHFTACEPDDATVTAFTNRLRRATTPVQPTRWLHPLRYSAAAAALIAVGFFTRGLLDHRPTTHTADTVTQVTQKKGIDVQRVETYEVTLRDDAGRVVAVQRFDSIDKAREFAADLSRWQSRNERLAGARFVVTADRF